MILSNKFYLIIILCHALNASLWSSIPLLSSPDACTINNTLNFKGHKSKSLVSNSLQKVVIDAGHGGKDPGGLGNTGQEKHIALGIALKLAKRINQQYPEVEVILTRKDDSFIPLYERAAIANRNNADLFISIHANIMPGSELTHGTETYVMGQHVAEHNLKVAKRENEVLKHENNVEQNYGYDPNSDEGHIIMNMFQHAYMERSIQFAELVESSLHQNGRRSRGVKQAGFVVLKETTMPSVLIETGFMSHPNEETYLLSESGQQTVADALLQAFAKYYIICNSSPTHTSTITYANSPYISPPTPAVEPPSEVLPTPSSHAAVLKKEVSPIRISYADYKQLYATEKTKPMKTRSAEVSAPIRRVNSQVWTPKSVIDTVPKRYSFNEARTARNNEIYKEDRKFKNMDFAIQLLASSNGDRLQDPYFKSCPKKVSVHHEDGLYKYQIRGMRNPSEVKLMKRKLAKLGYTDLITVIYQNGKRLSRHRKEALMN